MPSLAYQTFQFYIFSSEVYICFIFIFLLRNDTPLTPDLFCLVGILLNFDKSVPSLRKSLSNTSCPFLAYSFPALVISHPQLFTTVSFSQLHSHFQ